jgi:hypothetical protein
LLWRPSVCEIIQFAPQLKRISLGSVSSSMNGKPGDSPVLDITVHKLLVYSPDADALVVEIVRLGGRDEIEPKLVSEFHPTARPDLKRVTAYLAEVRDRRLRDAKERGWEVKGP